MATTTSDASQTLKLLEERLRRIEYAINGHNTSNPDETSRDNSAPQEKRSATARLRTLERTLQTLASKSPATADILHLHSRHPDLFHPSATATTQPSLPPSSLAALILAHAPLYHSTATQLRQLQDQQIPDPASAAKLAALEPRIRKAGVREAELSKEVAALRARSARAVEAWYENGVLGMGERWTGWEERLRAGEIAVRRAEGQRRREEGVV